ASRSERRRRCTADRAARQRAPIVELRWSIRPCWLRLTASSSRDRAKPGSSGLPARKAEVPDQRSEGSAEYDERRGPYAVRPPSADEAEPDEARRRRVAAD